MNTNRQPVYSTAKAYGRPRRNKYSDIVDDKTFLAMHWSEQEKVKRRYPNAYDKGDPGDFDNRTDNFDDPEGET